MHLSCICIYFFQNLLIYSCAHKFTHPLQNVHNVNNLNKIRGFIQFTCCFLFSTVLIKPFHITDVYIYSTRQNYTWIYKKLSHLIVYIPLYLNTMCHFLDDPRLVLYFVIVVHESLVGPEQFLDKSSSSCTFFGFGLLYIWTLPKVTVWFWDPYFHTEDNWGTHSQLLQKVETFTHTQEGNTIH